MVRMTLHILLLQVLYPASVVAQVVQWLISNSWEDSSCDEVCRTVGRRCTEDCWPQNAADLERAVNVYLKGVCYGVEDASQQKSLSYRSWNPAKDPVTRMCYWDSDSKFSSMSRCSLRSETPAHLLDEGPVRRICPCAIAGGNASNAAQCWAPEPEAASTPTSMGATSSEEPDEEQERCSQLCVDGFGGALADFNGQYIRGGGGGDGPYWEHGAGGGVALLRGQDGHWRLFGAETAREQLEGKIMDTGSARPIATSLDSVGSSDSDLPPDSTFETTQGFHQVEFRCCPTRTYREWNAPYAPPPKKKGSDGTAGVVLGVMFAIVCFIAMLIGGAIWIRKRHRVNPMWWKGSRSREEGAGEKCPGGSSVPASRDLESQVEKHPGILKASSSPNEKLELDAQFLDGGINCYSWTCKICSHPHNGPGDFNCLVCGREQGKEIMRKHKNVDELLASVVEKLEGRSELTGEGLQQPQSKKTSFSASIKGSANMRIEGHSNWDGKLVVGPQEEWPPKKKPLQPIQVSGSRRSSKNATPVGTQTPQGQPPGTLRLMDGPASNDSLRQAGRVSPSPMAKANGDRSGMALAASLGWGSIEDLEEGPKRRQSKKLPEVGSVVVLCNLDAYASWNGAEGEVVEIDINKGKVCVLLEDGHEKTVRASQCHPKRESLRDVQESKAEPTQLHHPLGECRSGECFYSNRRRAWDICYQCEGRLSQAVAKASKTNGGPRMPTPPRPSTPPGGGASAPSRQNGRTASDAASKNRRFKEARLAEQCLHVPAPPQIRGEIRQAQLENHQMQLVQQRNLPDVPATVPKGSVAQKQAQLNSSMARLKASLGRS